MTLEKLYKAKRIQEHIEELTKFKDELSILRPIKVGEVSTDVNEADIESLTKALEERISELEKAFEEL